MVFSEQLNEICQVKARPARDCESLPRGSLKEVRLRMHSVRTWASAEILRNIEPLAILFSPHVAQRLKWTRVPSALVDENVEHLQVCLLQLADDFLDCQCIQIDRESRMTTSTEPSTRSCCTSIPVKGAKRTCINAHAHATCH